MRLVLIANDDLASLDLGAAALAALPCEVLTAEDGDEAWVCIAQQRPGIAIMDVSMPGANGLELARRIRADPALAATYVIVLTAHAERALEGEAERA